MHSCLPNRHAITDPLPSLWVFILNHHYDSIDSGRALTQLNSIKYRREKKGPSLLHLKHSDKILGDGEITKKFNVTAAKLSKSAIAKIEAAGGSVTEIPLKKWVRTKKA